MYRNLAGKLLSSNYIMCSKEQELKLKEKGEEAVKCNNCLEHLVTIVSLMRTKSFATKLMRVCPRYEIHLLSKRNCKD